MQSAEWARSGTTRMVGAASVARAVATPAAAGFTFSLPQRSSAMRPAPQRTAKDSGF